MSARFFSPRFVFFPFTKIRPAVKVTSSRSWVCLFQPDCSIAGRIYFVMMSRSEKELLVSILHLYYTTKILVLLENRLVWVTEDGVLADVFVIFRKWIFIRDLKDVWKDIDGLDNFPIPCLIGTKAMNLSLLFKLAVNTSDCCSWKTCCFRNFFLCLFWIS